MRIVNTYPKILSLFEKMNGVFDMGLWEEYASQISIELPDKIKTDSRDYDFDNDILPVLNLALKNQEKLQIINHSFVKAIENLDEKMKRICQYDLTVDVVLYLGLCNGAGWATELNGKPTVLLGIEKILELDWGDYESVAALIYHELGHIWHFAVGGKRTMTPILQLYCEGVAMYIEQQLLGYESYHQDKDDWLKWCHSNKAALNAEYLRRLLENKSVKEFFGDWLCYQGHSDVGYFIGCEFIKHLLKSTFLTRLLN